MPKNALVKIAAQEIGKPLVEAGFRPRGLSWRLRSDRLDTAVVEIQKSRSALPGVELFYVNTGIVPGPWLDRLRVLSGEPAGKASEPSTADGFFFSRVNPPDMLDPSAWGGAWAVTDQVSASTVGRDAAARVSAEIPHLLRLLDRSEMLAEAERRPDRPQLLRVVLLADLGLTPELDSAIRQLDESDPHVQRFVEWAYGFANTR